MSYKLAHKSYFRKITKLFAKSRPQELFWKINASDTRVAWRVAPPSEFRIISGSQLTPRSPVSPPARMGLRVRRGIRSAKVRGLPRQPQGRWGGPSSSAHGCGGRIDGAEALPARVEGAATEAAPRWSQCRRRSGGAGRWKFSSSAEAATPAPHPAPPRPPTPTPPSAPTRRNASSISPKRQWRCRLRSRWVCTDGQPTSGVETDNLRVSEGTGKAENQKKGENDRETSERIRGVQSQRDKNAIRALDEGSSGPFVFRRH